MYRALLFPFLILFFFSPLRAEYFTINHYEVAIRINAGGWFDVDETLDVTFSSPRHGIYRLLPFRYLIDGAPYLIRIYDIEVPGQKWRRSWQNDDIRIRIGDPGERVSGRQRYRIRYRVKHAFLYPEEHTEFYWNLVGNGWDVPIDSISYRIELPPGVQPGPDDYRLFTGARGERGQDATIRFEEGALRGHSKRGFGPGEGLTVAIRLAPGAVARPGRLQHLWRKNGWLAVPLLLLLFTLAVWRRYGYNPPVTIVARYYPPAGLPPAEAGVLLKRGAKQRSVVALLPYWAGQGLIRMVEVEKKRTPQKGTKNKTDFELFRLAGLPEGSPAYERWVFDAIFTKGREKARLSTLKKRLFAPTHHAGNQIVETLRRNGCYASPAPVVWRIALPALLMISFPLIIVLLILLQFWAALALGLVIALGLILRFTSVKRSARGQALYQEIRGFHRFIARADRPRIERLLRDDPAYFEKTLPYAAAFGLTQRWVSLFSELFTEPPRWYVASSSRIHQAAGAFGAFAGGLDAGLREVQSVFSSRPAGGGGSFSGGGAGGSSGGGFGGGGGGSW